MHEISRDRQRRGGVTAVSVVRHTRAGAGNEAPPVRRRPRVGRSYMGGDSRGGSSLVTPRPDIRTRQLRRHLRAGVAVNLRTRTRRVRARRTEIAFSGFVFAVHTV